MENEEFPEALIDGGDFIRELLFAHDSGKTPEIMGENLRIAAQDFNLLLPESLL